MIEGFHHTGIVVRDLSAMVDFYTHELGLELLHEVDSLAPPEGDHTGVAGARRKLVFVGFPDGHQIELVHYIDPPSTDAHCQVQQLGAAHICFRVADLLHTYQVLRERGVYFLTEPKFRDIEGKSVGVVYAQDPEKNWLEFISAW